MSDTSPVEQIYPEYIDEIDTEPIRNLKDVDDQSFFTVAKPYVDRVRKARKEYGQMNETRWRWTQKSIKKDQEYEIVIGKEYLRTLQQLQEQARRAADEARTEFIQTKSEQALEKLKKTREEKAHAENVYKLACAEDTDVQRVRKESSEISTEISAITNKLHSQNEQIDDLANTIAYAYGFKDGENFWDRVVKISQKQLETKRRERAKRISEDPKKYGQLLGFSSFDEPTELQVELGFVIAATDEGGRPNEPNEDCVVIIPGTDEQTQEPQLVITVIDGMGGEADGETAAHLLGENIQVGIAHGKSMREIQEQASEEMADAGIINGGACYTTAKIAKDTLSISRAGDTRALVIRNRKVVFATQDEGFFEQVDNSVRGKYAGATTEETFQLQQNDLVILASDGVTDQLYPNKYKEVSFTPYKFDLEEETNAANQRIADVLTANGDLREGVQKLGEILDTEMENEGKPDQKSIVVYQHLPKLP